MRHICQLIRENHKLLNHENQSEKARALIKEQPVSFLNVEIEELKENDFLRKFEWSLISHESGWRRALLIHQVFSLGIDLKFDEHNFWDKESEIAVLNQFQ